MKLGARKGLFRLRYHNTLLGVKQGQGMQSLLVTKIARNCLQMSWVLWKTLLPVYICDFPKYAYAQNIFECGIVARSRGFDVHAQPLFVEQHIMYEKEHWALEIQWWIRSLCSLYNTVERYKRSPRKRSYAILVKKNSGFWSQSADSLNVHCMPWDNLSFLPLDKVKIECG